MDVRIIRLKSSKDARTLAANARRLGNDEIEAAAIQRARELQAIEEGYVTPAERAIGEALIAYEDEMRKVKPKFRASRTRNMLKRHTPLIAAERMVFTKKPSTGYAVLEDAGRRELSFESIIDRFPEEFSTEALNAARARLAGLPPPKVKSHKEIELPQESHTIELSADHYVQAMQHLHDEAAIRWLVAHSFAVDSTASMQELAEMLDLKTYHRANSGYGALAHKIALLLPRAPDDVEQRGYVDWMQAVGVVVGKNSLGHSVWQLRGEVAEALQRLKWVDPEDVFDPPTSDEATESQQAAAREYGLDDTQTRQMMLSRRGQGLFRRKVMQFWGNACAVSGLRYPAFLIASHIVPWKDANPNERLDGYNGLPLTPNLDKAFDKGFISFEPDGRIKISTVLSEDLQAALGIHRKLRLTVKDVRIERYMSFHRENVFKI